MTSSARSVTCSCGQTTAVPEGTAVDTLSCPGCGKPLWVSLSPEPAAPDSPVPHELSIEKIFLQKGWITEEDLREALLKLREGQKSGVRKLLGETLVELGKLSPEQVREALEAQGRVPMRCPRCKKSFNVKKPPPGNRVLCRGCRVPLELNTKITDLHVESSSEDNEHEPLGEVADSAIAELIPGYVIRRRLGAGGMGDVYLGEHRTLGKHVAVKLLAPEYSKDPAYIERFLKEAKAASSVQHENIVSALDAGEAGGRHYYTMEYVEGETIEKILRREGPFPERSALGIVKQVALGLKHAHLQGVIHRDIKPANLILSTSGLTKILDFGLARDLKTDVSLTQPGVVHTSPGYASPEQARGEKSIDHRSDMYSLGITLYEMLTGKLPFDGDVSSAVLVKHVTETPKPPRDLNPAVSPQVNAFVLRLLRKTPQGRYAAYDDLVSAIDSLLAPKAARPPTVRALRVRSARKKPWLVPAVGGGAVAALAILIIVLSGGNEPSDSPLQPAAAPADPKRVEFDRRLGELRELELRSRGAPSLYPDIRRRWTALEKEYRGTKFHPFVAGPLLEFENWLDGESGKVAAELGSQVDRLKSSGRPAEAIRMLKSYPEGFAETSGALRVEEQRDILERSLKKEYEESRDQVLSHIAAEEFDEARREWERIRARVSYLDKGKTRTLEPRYDEELQGLDRQIQEALLLARQKAAKEKSSTPDPAPTAKTTVPAKSEAAPATTRKPVPAPPPPAKPALRPIPDAAARKESKELIMELFKGDYSRKDALSKRALGMRLLALARETQDDDTGRYVLFREAARLSAAGGNTRTAFQAIDAVCREYEGNPFSMKSVVLATVTQGETSVESLKAVAEAYLQLADEAVAAENFEAAEQAAGNAGVMGRRARSIPLVGRATTKRREIEKQKADFAARMRNSKSTAGLSGGKIDLLALIDSEKDAVQGAWSKNGNTLSSPDLPWARIQIPYLPPEEYDLEVVVERKGRPQSFILGLVSGKAAFSVVLDGSDGKESGLHRVGGKDFFENETTYKKRLFNLGSTARVVCSVRTDRVKVSFNGETVIDWKADYSKVSPDPRWAIPEARVLFLGSYSSRFEVTEVMLTPREGTGKPLR